MSQMPNLQAVVGASVISQRLMKPTENKTDQVRLSQDDIQEALDRRADFILNAFEYMGQKRIALFF